VHTVQAKTTRTIGGVSFSGMKQILNNDPWYVTDSTPAQLTSASAELVALMIVKVPELTAGMNIKFNKRVALRRIQTGLAWLFSRADWTNLTWTGVPRD
jgi:hypothetical protein